MATDETRAEASDPTTSPTRLQELTSDAELWPLIAANPNAYDALLTWLGENGGPDVQAAIAGRGAGAEPTAVLPPSPMPAAAPPLTPPPGGAALPPPGGYAQQPPAGYPAPGAPGGAPQGGGGSKKGLWIVLAVVVGLLVASGIGVGVWALTKGDDDSDTRTDDNSDTDNGDDSNGDDSDRDDSDDDQGSSDLTCDDLDDLYDAAYDLTFYFPDIDDESVLDDTTEIIAPFADFDAPEIQDAVEVMLDFADAVRDDPDAAYGPEYSEASDSLDSIQEYIDTEC